MIASLLWLTVSLPFVTSFKDQLASQYSTEGDKYPVSHCDDNNSLSGSTEEKTTNSNSASEEYLHGHVETPHHITAVLTHFPGDDENIAVSFSAELLSPPPEKIPS